MREENCVSPKSELWATWMRKSVDPEVFMCFIRVYKYMLLIGSIDTTPVGLGIVGNNSKLGTLQHTASCPSFRVVPYDFREYVSRMEGETDTDNVAMNFKCCGTHNLSTIRGKQKRETL